MRTSKSDWLGVGLFVCAILFAEHGRLGPIFDNTKSAAADLAHLVAGIAPRPSCPDARATTYPSSGKEVVTLHEDCWSGWIEVPDGTGGQIDVSAWVEYEWTNGRKVLERRGENRPTPREAFPIRARGVGTLTLYRQ